MNSPDISAHLQVKSRLAVFGSLSDRCVWKKGGRVKNKFFTQRVCVCALLATNIDYAQKAAQK